jgi:molecular chaperone DnaK
VLDDDLGLWLDEIESGQVTVILDCCHSGTGTKAPDDDLMPRFLPGNRTGAKPAAESPWRELRDISKAPGRQTVAFFACRPAQQAYERLIPGNQPPARRGLFSYYFLEGLRDGAADLDGDGIVRNQEILQYVANRLDQSFNRARPSPADRQQPSLETDFPEAAVLGRSARYGSSRDQTTPATRGVP